MEECIFLENSEKSLEDCFFAEYTISRNCKVRPCQQNFSCRNPTHLKISKINIKNIQEYLHKDIKGCLIWLGLINGNRPIYNNVDLRKLIYLSSGHIPQGYRISLTCNEIKCLNLDHMYLVEKIEGIKTSKLNYEKATEIRVQWLSHRNSTQLCEKYEITRQNLSLILNNKIWIDNKYLGKIRGFQC